MSFSVSVCIYIYIYIYLHIFPSYFLINGRAGWRSWWLGPTTSTSSGSQTHSSSTRRLQTFTLPPRYIYLSIHICLCQFLYLPFYLSINIYIYLYIYIHISIYLTFYLSFYLPIYQSTDLSILPFLSFSVNPSKPIYNQSFGISIYLYMYLLLYQEVCILRNFLLSYMAPFHPFFPQKL